MKKIILFMALTVFTGGFGGAQDHSAEAKTYFEQYLDSRSFAETCINALPTLEECKKVFKAKHADTYFKYIEQMREKAKGEVTTARQESFAAVRMETFTVKDIETGKGNYPGGMDKVLDKLVAGTVFYRVNLLRQKDAENGVAYNVFVYMGGRWVFFPKPWRAFE